MHFYLTPPAPSHLCEGQLVRVIPLYYECINPRKYQKKFWEIAPTKWNKNGSITTFTTAWGRIGCRGSSKERSCDFHELDNLISKKTSEGYQRRPRPEARIDVPIEGMDLGNIALCIETGNSLTKLLLGSEQVLFPTIFLQALPKDE